MELYELEKRLTEDTKFLAHSYKVDTTELIVNIQTSRKSYGMTSLHRWEDDIDKLHEISLNPEYFKEPLEILDTIIHELAHLSNYQRGIKDTSRSGTYHNDNFKKTAEEMGLKCIKTKKSGYNTTPIGNEETLNRINRDLPYPIVQSMTRIPDRKSKTPSKSKNIKYKCPQCGCSCRATKEIRIMCMDCEAEMLPEIKEAEA